MKLRGEDVGTGARAFSGREAGEAWLRSFVRFARGSTSARGRYPSQLCGFTAALVFHLVLHLWYFKDNKFLNSLSSIAFSFFLAGGGGGGDKGQAGRNLHG